MCRKETVPVVIQKRKGVRDARIEAWRGGGRDVMRKGREINTHTQHETDKKFISNIYRAQNSYNLKL